MVTWNAHGCIFVSHLHSIVLPRAQTAHCWGPMCEYCEKLEFSDGTFNC